MIVTIGALVVFLVNFFWSLFAGKEVRQGNPWRATTLEWFLPTPIPDDDFGHCSPAIYRSAYVYGVQLGGLDFLPQHVSPERLARFR
jgi:cytochrome c oxidase subunit 1